MEDQLIWQRKRRDIRLCINIRSNLPKDSANSLDVVQIGKYLRIYYSEAYLVIRLVTFSITIDSFINIESLENTIESLVELGIRNIEVSGDPSNSSRKNLELFNTYSIYLLV